MSDVEMTLTLNGREVTGRAPADTTLVRWLRDKAQAYEVKEGCNEGTCGTCETGVLEGAIDAPLEAVRVIVTEMPKAHFGIGGQSAKKRGR